MKSFRSEFENSVVEKDIIELERKINAFHNGQVSDEQFRTLRLARGIYGQRQAGVQMIRIKIPYGKLNAKQLRRIAEVSDTYSTGKLHITTRQDIQIHHVSLDDTPQLWNELEKDQITIREACGNTVRNITASELSGVDPNEVFDVRPYAEEVFRYFLRNPICQEMGRKFKISFSSSSADTALSFMHDLGFIARENRGELGFKIMVAGGLGSQSRQADILFEFYPASDVIPLVEATLRLFDRYGERSNRMKARLKFWVKAIGIETFKSLLDEELKTVPQTLIDTSNWSDEIHLPRAQAKVTLSNSELLEFNKWKKRYVTPQKQEGLFAIKVNVTLGDFSSEVARELADLIEGHSGNELTFTIDQNFIIRHVPENQLEHFYRQLNVLEFNTLSISNVSNITACPGTDTCNLGIANSTSLALEIDKELNRRYADNSSKEVPSIKISGCMNSCGQHMIANIGFQGMSIKTKDGKVLPAAQVLLGGGNLENGNGSIADKVIKIPSKRAIKALQVILNEYDNSNYNNFLPFYQSLGDRYFYELLKDFTSLDYVSEDEFYDWGQKSTYQKEIGIGECAGVVIDLVSSLIKEGEEKIINAKVAFTERKYADSAYHSYSALINVSKALLVDKGLKTNSHHLIVEQFQEEFIASNELEINGEYKELASRHSSNKITAELALDYLGEVNEFIHSVNQYRTRKLEFNEQ